MQSQVTFQHSDDEAHTLRASSGDLKHFCAKWRAGQGMHKTHKKQGRGAGHNPAGAAHDRRAASACTRVQGQFHGRVTLHIHSPRVACARLFQSIDVSMR
jgi:hypothetical protein